MTDFCVFKFKDESLGRITPTELVRVDKKKFTPVSAKDLPEGKVDVKWQKSVSDGSFLGDGYFPAEIFAIAGSLKTAEAKAQELKLRLHSSPLLALPAAKSPKSPKTKLRASKHSSKQGSAEGDAERSVNPELKEAQSSKSSKGKGKQDKSNKETDKLSNKGLKKKNELVSSAIEHTVEKAKPDPKKKRIKLNPVAMERTAKHAKLAECTNPLLQNVTLDCNAEKTSNCLQVKQEPQDVAVISGVVDFDSTLLEVKQEPQDLTGTSDVDDLYSTPEISFGISPAIAPGARSASPASTVALSRSPSPASSAARSRSASPVARSIFASPADGVARSRSVSPAGTDSESYRRRAGSPDGSSSHAEVKLDDKIKDLVDGDSSDSTSDSSSNSSDSEDDVSRLSSENKALKQTVKSLKEKLTAANRDYTLANNLRIGHLKRVNKLEASLKEKTNEVESLLKRNSLLQDLLLQKHKEKNVTKSDKIKTIKKEEDEFSGYKKEKKEGKATKESDHSKKEDRKGSTKDSNSTRTDSTSFNASALSSVKKEKDDNTAKNSDPKKSANSTSSNEMRVLSSGKKDKKRKRDSDLNDPEINLVCQNVLKQLRKENDLVPDKAGFVNVGLDVHMDKDAMLNQLAVTNDLSKITKGLTALTWTTSQREERSLEGGKNNRYPDAPAKKAATPKKVNAVLGVLKAHLLHSGDVEGPGMAQNLNTCRKSIGTKFAMDAQAKRRM